MKILNLFKKKNKPEEQKYQEHISGNAHAAGKTFEASQREPQGEIVRVLINNHTWSKIFGRFNSNPKVVKAEVIRRNPVTLVVKPLGWKHTITIKPWKLAQ